MRRSEFELLVTLIVSMTYGHRLSFQCNAEVRDSIPLCSTNRINDLRQGSDPAFFICHRFVTCRNGFHQVFKCSALRLIGSVRVAQSHSNIRPSEDFSQCKRIGPAVCHAGSGGVTQVMKPKVSDSCILLCLIKTELNVDKASFRLRTWKDIFACPR